MADDRFTEFLNRIGGWDGFDVVGVTTEETPGPDAVGLPAPRLIIELRPTPGAPKRCSRCGEVVVEIHDTSVRRIRDLPIGEWDTWLLVPRARLQCPRCGPTVEAVSWLDRYQRMTKRLADKIAGLAQVVPIKHVAAWFGVSWDTVKQIDQRALADRLGAIDAQWDELRVLAIDEFALQRGYRYATVVIDPTRKRVVWIARGRDQLALRGFFTALGPARCAALEAVALDMWAPYAAEVRAHCPRAELVYDLFHVVAKYGGEVIDRVRVDETNRLAPAIPATGPGPIHPRRAQRRVIKGTRWLLLRNREHLTSRADRVRLRELLRVNRPLFIVYVLKDDLKRLWRFRYRAVAYRFWRDWRRRALASRIPALRRFVTLLERHLDGILSHCRYPLNTGMLEGINNKIKVIKRMAYGFRDDAYFFLKIRAAFPGIP
jgi:transposase